MTTSPTTPASPSNPIAIFGDNTCKMQILIDPFSVGPNVIPFTADTDLPTSYVFQLTKTLVHTQEYKRHWNQLTAKKVVVADRAAAQKFASLIQPMLVAEGGLKKTIRNLSPHPRPAAAAPAVRTGEFESR